LFETIRTEDDREHSCDIHFYITGTSLYRVEAKRLLDAFKVARPDVELPNRKIF